MHGLSSSDFIHQFLPDKVLGSHQRALAFLGGVPECIVPDNLKSGINAACRYEPELNRSYQEFAEHYGVAVIPTRVRKPRDKAKVEKAVQYQFVFWDVI